MRSQEGQLAFPIRLPSLYTIPMIAAVIIICLGLLTVSVRVWRSFNKTRADFSITIEQRLEAVGKMNEVNWVVCGMMGSGKTFLAGSLSHALGLEHIEIDDFPSKEETVDFFSKQNPSEVWIGEANPWQIPAEVFRMVKIVVFMDFDNAVNYVRLLCRGFQRWREERFGWKAFRHHVWEMAIKDWCRIVYLHGKANREGWREKGISGLKSDEADFSCIRCISPAEVRVLVSRIENYGYKHRRI